MWLKWELCDRNQTVLSELTDRRAGGKVNLGLNAMRRAQLPLSLESEAREMANAIETLLRVTLEGPESFALPLIIGRVSLPEGDSTAEGEQLMLNAVDQLFQLERRLIRKVTGSVWEAVTYTGTDQAQIMWNLINLFSGHGVVKGTLQGGGINRDRTYPPGKELGLALVQMSEVINGPDFELTPTIATDGTLATFNTYYPRLGSDKSAAIRFVHAGKKEDTAVGFNYSLDGAIANRVIAIGAPKEEPSEASPYGIYPGYVAEHAGSIAELGVFEERMQLEDVVETATLEAHAKGAVAAAAFPITFFDFEVAPERFGTEIGSGIPPEFGRDYWIGDTIGCDAYLGGSDVALELAGRITDAELTELESGQLQVKLTCTPEVSSAGVTGSAITLKIPEGFS